MKDSRKVDGRPNMPGQPFPYRGRWRRFTVGDGPSLLFPRGIGVPGVYVICVPGEAMPLYIGCARDLQKRLREHIKPARYSGWWNTRWGQFRALEVAVRGERRQFESLMVEARLLHRVATRFNQAGIVQPTGRGGAP